MAQTRQPVRSRRRHGGQVLVITLLSMALLAGLVFYVINVGTQVNRRRDMQDAADATAISGAVWMARNMNLVAMNNVGQAKLLSLVPVMDALPLASQMARRETSQWVRALSEQIDRGIPHVAEQDIIESAVRNLRDRMALQRDILIPIDEALNNGGFDMEQITHYRTGRGGPPPQGVLWQAAEAMDELSQATVETAGVYAQASAIQFGQRSGGDRAFLGPLLPRIPAQRGGFGDFEYCLRGRMVVRDNAMEGPSRSDGPGGVIPDAEFPHRLGPWARLHRWRTYIRRPTSWEYVEGDPGYGRTRGGGGVSISGRRNGGSARSQGGGSSGGWHATGWETYGYIPYGPYNWALRQIGDWAFGYWIRSENRRTGHLADTRFNQYVSALSNIKLGYMFQSRTPRSYHIPDWDYLEYPQAKLASQRPEVRVHNTMFYLIEIASRIQPGSPGYLSPGSYRANSDYAIAIWAGGWVDPAQWGVPQVGNYVWRDRYTYEVTADSGLGIEMKFDGETGQPIWQTVYMTSYYVFGGIDVGSPEEIRNPANWQDDDRLPAPMLLDTETAAGDAQPWTHLDRDTGMRRDHFTYLGAVRKANPAKVWDQRFGNPNPAGPIVTLAQAAVFNNKSWDLWTQDWQAKLVPLTQWDDWIIRVDESRIDLPELDMMVRDEDVLRVLEVMRNLGDGLAGTYRTH